MRLEAGMLIKTNYSGPYRIQSVDRECVCPLYEDQISRTQKPQRPHIHLICTRPDGSGQFWLNWWLEESLQSLTKSFCGGKAELDFDLITILPADQPVQGSIL